MKTPVAYRAEREGGIVRAWVEYSDGTTEPLPHLVHHSPTGFEYGYAGSGPADLARSIIGHYLHEPDPHPRIYQAFKFAFIASAPSSSALRIPVEHLEHWLAEKRAGARCRC